MRRVHRVLLSAILGVSLLGVLVPVSAVMAASCGGSAAACDHTSPQTTGCSADAVTQLTAYIKDLYGNRIAKVELRSSASCRTAWSRVTILAPADFGAFSTKEWVIRNPDGATDTRTDSGLSNGDSAYSHQLYVKGKSARACAFVSNGTVSDGQACTSYVSF